MRGSRRLAVVAVIALAGWGCTVSDIERPPVTGPSELALALSVLANPDAITRDGESQSQIVIEARDVNGQAVAGVDVRLDIVVNNLVRNEFGLLSAYSAVTASNGRAVVTYTAPEEFRPDEEDDLASQFVSIRATPVGTNAGMHLPRFVNIRLVSVTPDQASVASSR